MDINQIVCTLQLMGTDEWCTKNSIKTVPLIHDTKSIEVMEGVHFFMYQYCTPVIRFIADDDFIELTFDGNDAEIFTGTGSVYVPVDTKEEEYFQLSTIKDLSWLTFEMFHYGVLACRKHFEIQEKNG